MSALSEPVFELKQDSEIYKKLKKRKDMQKDINDIIDEIASEYEFNPEDFAYYSSLSFGFSAGTDSREQFKSHLTKRSDENGIYKFKKNQKLYKEISEKMKDIDEINDIVSPWWMMDVFGLNNAKATQWIGDRHFIQVKNESKASARQTEKVQYTDYLEILNRHLKKENS